MDEPPNGDHQDHDEAFARNIAAKAERRRRAAARGPNVLSWLGAFGMVGWTVALCAIGGALIGRWLDGFTGGTVSWTLTLLLAGLALGAILAWAWVQREGGRRE